MRHLRLGSKILIAGLLVLIVPLVVVGVVAVWQANTNITDLARSDLSHTAQGVALGVQSTMKEQVITASTIASSTSVMAAAMEADAKGAAAAAPALAVATKELDRVKAGDARTDALVIIAPDGTALASTSRAIVGQDLSERPYFKTAMQGTANVGDVIVSKATGNEVIVAAAPIYDASRTRVVGVVSLGQDRAPILDLTSQIKIHDTGYVYVVDSAGLYLQHPVADNILAVNITQIQGMESVAQAIAAKRDGVVSYTLDGVKKLAAVHAVPITGWFVVATVPEAELYESAQATRNVIIVIGLVAIAVGALIFVLFARSVTRPMRRLVAAADHIAAGDLQVEVPDDRRGDEVGSLARSFNAMLASLRQKTRIAEKISGGDLSVGDVAVSENDALGSAFSTMVDVLRRQSHDIREGVSVLASAGSEIMASVSQLTSSVAQTSTAVSETTTTAEEVKHTTDVSAQKAQHVSELGQRSLQISQEGQQSIEDTIRGMERIREQVQAISDMVVRLSEQSQAIGAIIGTVNDLAEQSNLLAVNAAIEAAKAGEQGRGFGVVAQEIRSLASQSKQATAEVRTILFDVQKAISSAVMVTEQGGKAVEEGVALSRQAGQAMDVLSESVAEATDAAVQIAASSHQQLMGMDQVVSAMENIREAAVQMSAGAQQTERTVLDLQSVSRRLQEIAEFYRD